VRYTQASRAKAALWEDNELVVHCESRSTRRRQCHVYKAFDMDGGGRGQTEGCGVVHLCSGVVRILPL